MNHLKKVYQFHQSKPWKPEDSPLNGLHYDSFLKELNAAMGDDYNKFRFVLYDHNMHAPLPEFPIHGQDVILIFQADEKCTIPIELSSKFFAILKAFYPLPEPTQNIIPYPLGYSNAAGLTRMIDFEERTYDATYAGNFLANRLDFYRQFNALKYFPPFPINSKLARKYYYHALKRTGLYKPGEYHNTFGKSFTYWTGGFAKGLPREEYANLISNTRIALCPKGFLCTECFRHFEVMRLGCVIVTDDLPDSRWYRGSPLIVENDWLNIEKTVKQLLADPKSLLDIHHQTLQWWKNVCSEKAAAQYIALELEKLPQ